MDHIVKLAKSDLIDESTWDRLIFQLTAIPEHSLILSVELTVKSVFFELET